MSVTARHDRPVLLCYDGSDHAEEAIRSAGALMGDRPAIVLHVTGRRRPNTVAEDGRRLALGAGFDPVSVVDDSTGAVAQTILADVLVERTRTQSRLVLRVLVHTTGSNQSLVHV